MSAAPNAEARRRTRFPVPRLPPAASADAPTTSVWQPSPLPTTSGNILGFVLLLLPYLWIFRTTILSQRKSDVAAVGAYQLLQIIIVALTVLAIVASVRAPQLWQISRGRPALMVVYYYVFCLLTAALSALPQYSAYRSIEFVALMAAIFLAFSYRKDFFVAERDVIVFSASVIFITWLARGLAFGFSLSWHHWHSNDFPAGGAMLFCYCVGEYFGDNHKRRVRLLIGGATGFIFMMLGTSTGSFASAAAGLLAVAYFRRNPLLFVGAAFCGVLLVLLDTLGAFQTQDVLDVVAMGKDEKHLENISGRLPIWTYYFENYVRHSPLIGNGLGTLSDEVTGQLVKTQPHASVLSALLYTGACGMIFYLGFVFRCMKDGFWACSRGLPGAVGCVAAIATGFINSQTNPFVFDIFEATSAIFCVFLALFTLFVVIPAKQSEAEESKRKTPLPLAPKVKPHAHHLRRPLVP